MILLPYCPRCWRASYTNRYWHVPRRKDWQRYVCTTCATTRWNRCITALKAERDYDEVIFTSPDGERFDQHMANELSMKGNLIILAGHYKGIDQRVRDHLITKEISIGDFVLTGGELVAAMIADAIVRVVPGVIGDEQSALSDCFQDDRLAAPIYTRPADYKGWKVPEILLSGNEAKIRNWELEQAMERTRKLRPDLLEEK